MFLKNLNLNFSREIELKFVKIIQIKLSIFLVKLKFVKIIQTKVSIFLVKLKLVKIIQTKVTIYDMANSSSRSSLMKE